MRFISKGSVEASVLGCTCQVASSICPFRAIKLVMKVLLNAGSVKFSGRKHEHKLDDKLQRQPCEHMRDVPVWHTCRKSFTCFSTLTTVCSVWTKKIIKK